MEDYRSGNYYIRKQMMEPIKRYVEQRSPVGSFLTAVICNDLKMAVLCADDENLANLPAFVAYFYNEVTSTCWGSPEAMEKWMGGGE